jgi:S1-C subfamily serine protease
LSAFLAIGLGVAGCNLPVPLPTAPGPKALSADQVFTIAKPATVLVQVNYQAKVSLPKLTITDAKFEQVRAKLQADYDSGRNRDLTNHDVYVKAFDKEIDDNPDKYYSAGTELITQDVPEIVQGSGFVATADGYIVTSAHVVATKDEEIRTELTADLLKGIKEGTHRSIGEDTNLTADQQAKFETFFGSYAEKNLKVADLQKAIHVAIGRGTPGKPLETNGIRAEIAVAGDPIPGKDVAILKIDTKDQLPTLQVIDDEKNLKKDQEITVVGFPGDSIFKDQDTDPRAVEPSTSHGGFDPTGDKQEGYTALSVNAGASHGQSGGPALDAQGHVVGVTAFILQDPDTEKVTPDLSFEVPASVIREYLDKAKVNNTESPATTEFVLALRQFEQQHYKTALPMFRDVKSKWPGNPYVDSYITQSENGIVEKRDKTPPSLGELAAYTGGGLGGLLLVLLVVYLFLRQRRRHRAQLAALVAAGGFPGGAAPAAALPAVAPGPLPATPPPPVPDSAAAGALASVDAPPPTTAPEATIVRRRRAPATPAGSDATIVLPARATRPGAKPAPKAAARAASKPASSAGAKAAPKTASKPGPSAAAKPAAKPAPKPAAKQAPRPGLKAATKAAAKPSPTAAARSAAKPAPKAAARPAAAKRPRG